MNKKILLGSLSLLLTISMVACGSNKGSETNSNENNSSLESSSSDSDSSSSEGRKTAKELLRDSLAKDYSNCTVGTASLYKQFEDDLDSEVVEYDTTILHYKGYSIIYDELMAEYGYPNPYLYYHDYEGQNLLYFSPDYEGGPEAWLAEYETGTSYALRYTAFYLPDLLEKLDVNFAQYYAGFYYITDEEEVERLNREVFPGIWENDIQNVAIALDSDGYLSKIYCFEELDNDTEYCVINISNIGTTVFDDSKLPTAPNEDNVMEYWQYKGWNGPTVNVFPTAISVNATDPVVAAQNPVTLEIEQKFFVESNLTWPTLDEERHNVLHEHVTWHSTDENVATCSYERVGNEWVRTVVAVGAGTCEIYAVAEGVNENVSYDTYDQGVESNHIAVKVSSLAELDKTGAKYDLYFASVTDGVLSYSNWASGTGVNGTAQAMNAKVYNNNDLFYENGEEIGALILDPNNMQAEASVTFELTENVSKVAFYYGMYYDHSAGLSHLKWVKIESSTDGENWNTVDVTTQVKTNISYKNLKLMETNVTEGKFIRISVKSDMVGASFAFATSNIVLY